MAEKIEATVELVIGGKRYASMQSLSVSSASYHVLEQALSALTAALLERVLDDRAAGSDLDAKVSKWVRSAVTYGESDG